MTTLDDINKMNLADFEEKFIHGELKMNEDKAKAGGRRFHFTSDSDSSTVSMKEILNRIEFLIQGGDEESKAVARRVLTQVLESDTIGNLLFHELRGTTRSSLNQLNPFGAGKSQQIERITNKIIEDYLNDEDSLNLIISKSIRQASKNHDVQFIRDALEDPPTEKTGEDRLWAFKKLRELKPTLLNERIKLASESALFRPTSNEEDLKWEIQFYKKTNLFLEKVAAHNAVFRAIGRAMNFDDDDVEPLLA